MNLSNSTDYLAIEDASSMMIDEVLYDQASGLDPSGRSRNLNPQYLAAGYNDNDTNFCEGTSPISGSADLGSPGGTNDSCP